MPEQVYLPTGGSVPGIPGSHGPGRYIIDWIERTLTPVVDVIEGEIAHIEEAIHPEPAPAPEVPVAPMPTEPVDVPEQSSATETSAQPE